MTDIAILDKVSIIVPIYNVGNYLQDCIDSLLFQTYSNLEIILIDDGSTDRSAGIIDEYREKDQRIQCVHQRNKGLSSARNAGLNCATGKYVVFVDGDDYILHDTIETLYHLIVSYGGDIAAIGSFRNEPFVECMGEKTKPIVLTGKACADSLTDDRSFYPHRVWGKMFKRDLFVSIRFPDGLNQEDTYYSFITALRAKYIVLDKDNRKYFYRLREGSITTTHTFNNHSFDWYYIWCKCFKETTHCPALQEKCARRVIRSYIHVVGDAYSTKQRSSISSKMKDMNKSVGKYYSKAELNFLEIVSFQICRHAPHLMGLAFVVRKACIRKKHRSGAERGKPVKRLEHN